MQHDIFTVLRRGVTGLCAIALAAGSFWFAREAGCAENAAGSTIASLDNQLVSVWLMISSLILFTALFIAAGSSPLRQAILRAAVFLAAAIPLTFATLLHVQSHALEESQCQAPRTWGIGALP